MRTSHPRLPTLTRAFALVLLLVGLVMNPVLAFIGDIHDLDHAASSADVDPDGHVHADDHSHHTVLDSDSDSAASDEDGEGWHGLLHLSHGCAPATAVCTAMLLTPVPLHKKLDAPFTASLAPLKRISEPFRPPIS